MVCPVNPIVDDRLVQGRMPGADTGMRVHDRQPGRLLLGPAAQVPGNIGCVGLIKGRCRNDVGLADDRKIGLQAFWRYE